MISISVGEAKNKLPFFLHLVEENNESIEITRHGKTVASIICHENSPCHSAPIQWSSTHLFPWPGNHCS